MLYSRNSLHTPFAIRDKFFDLDFVLLFAVLLLGIISIFAQFSSNGGQWGSQPVNHAIRFLVFFLFFISISFINISVWNRFSLLIFIFFIFLLLAVKFFGLQSQGSRRWINLYVFILQPSELMKIGIILFLANYYHRTASNDVNKLKYLLIPLIAIFIPFTMVLTQPDLGTALLILFSGVVVTWLAGVRWKIFAYLSLLALISTPIAISFLKPYQKGRILSFLNPDLDPLGVGYQIIQSKIAIGSGGLFGKGFLNGSQAYLDFLPEKHTDFIFTLFAEEFGFFGSIFMVFLYFLITYRIIIIGSITRSIFGKLFCYGFSTAFFIYVTVNMSMVLGLLPIVGAPLPILSYGGSSMLAIMFGLGIVMSCKIYNNYTIS
jgi:rod shape determining protein RodA